MNNKRNGIIMIALGIILTIIYLAWPIFPIYIYWIAVILLIVYGVYLYLRA